MYYVVSRDVLLEPSASEGTLVEEEDASSGEPTAQRKHSTRRRSLTREGAPSAALSAPLHRRLCALFEAERARYDEQMAFRRLLGGTDAALRRQSRWYQDVALRLLPIALSLAGALALLGVAYEDRDVFEACSIVVWHWMLTYITWIPVRLIGTDCD